MDFGSMRALAHEAAFGVMGVPATITRPDDTPIVTSIIWLTSVTEDANSGMDLQRREAKRSFAVLRSAVSSVPRGSKLVAPDLPGGTVRRWRIDGVERAEPDQVRYRVVLDPDPYDTDPEL